MELILCPFVCQAQSKRGRWRLQSKNVLLIYWKWMPLTSSQFLQTKEPRHKGEDLGAGKLSKAVPVPRGEAKFKPRQAV